MRLSFRLVEIFLAVARHRSFTRAATELRLSQPAISRAIRELERQAGVILLHRGRSGVKLTEGGTALLAHARIIFAEARAAEDDLSAIEGLSGGTLRIGASPTIATYMVPSLLHQYALRYPGVELSLRTAPSRGVARLLLEREVDIALVETPVAHPRLAARVWAEDQLMIVAAASHPLVGRAKIPPSLLTHELLIIRESRSGTYEFILRTLKVHGVVPKRLLEVDTVDAIPQIVAAGVGIAALSQCAARDALALGRIATLDVKGWDVRRPFTQLSLAEGGGSTAASAFEQMINTNDGRP